MACYFPLHGWRSASRNETGKRSIVFTHNNANLDQPVTLPCGQCIGCKLEKSRQWAIRCLHESTLHPDSSFITLTYAPEYLPPDGGLVKADLQSFFKRLRHNTFRKIRYFACGEYGDENGRPHYHAIVFGRRFPDGKQITIGQYPLYSSAELDQIWGMGRTSVGEVSFESAAYVARYTTKKVTGKAAAEHYTSLNPETGEIHQIDPEFCVMSRRPGIGADWYRKFKQEIYRHDNVISRGREMLPPKYYDALHERDEAIAHVAVKMARKSRVQDRDYHALVAGEKIARAKLELKRKSL